VLRMWEAGIPNIFSNVAIAIIPFPWSVILASLQYVIKDIIRYIWSHDRVRTCSLRISNPSLYPVELRGEWEKAFLMVGLFLAGGAGLEPETHEARRVFQAVAAPCGLLP
ncbi:MAG: hypothetical protein WCC64_05290, partial [Aliidongia sp.]